MVRHKILGFPLVPEVKIPKSASKRKSEAPASDAKACWISGDKLGWQITGFMPNDTATKNVINSSSGRCSTIKQTSDDFESSLI